MGQITVEKNVNGIEGLCIIKPRVHGDSRGFFMETYNKRDLNEAGIEVDFVQDNQSMSTKGVLRGMHLQLKHSQTKLVRVISGSVYDVVIDCRINSKTFGKWFGIELSKDNKKQLLIPKGFAHGFLVLSDVAEFMYKVDEFYYPDDEIGIIWDDPEVSIIWPGEKEDFILAQRDLKWSSLKEILHILEQYYQ